MGAYLFTPLYPTHVSYLGHDMLFASRLHGELAEGFNALAPQVPVVGRSCQGNYSRCRTLVQHALPQALLGRKVVEDLQEYCGGKKCVACVIQHGLLLLLMFLIAADWLNIF